MAGPAELETPRPALGLGHRGPIVLAALDESSDHPAARAWAADEAAARHAALLPVTLSAGSVLGSPAGEQVAPRADVDARTADLLIVGTAEHDAAAIVLASLPRLGRRRLACPVIVLRGRGLVPIRRIVVGVASGPSATAALRWAVDEAAMHRAELVVVHAWQPQTGVGRSSWRDSLDRAAAHRVVELAVLECAEQRDGTVRSAVVEGDAGSVLVTAAEDADLLVVGSRAQSGFTAMSFGPVTTFVVDAAACPVAIVDPRAWPDRSPGRGPGCSPG